LVLGFGLGSKEPAKQFALVREHIDRIRKRSIRWRDSVVYIYVERNLGFEAEHHQKALDSIPGVKFRVDYTANRVGVYTTNSVKHAACELLNVMFREGRVEIYPALVSRDNAVARTRLREQLEVFSYQYKLAENVFQTERVALSGKVGGMRDDIAICLQLGVYFTNNDLTVVGRVPT
jgi:hypothetical protein